MYINNIIEKQLAKKGMSKMDLHLAIVDLYVGGEYCKYTNFSEKLRKDRLTAEDLVYISLVLDMDLNVLKSYLKKDIMLYNRVSKCKVSDATSDDKDLENVLKLLNENSMYLGKNASSPYVSNIMDTNFKVSDYRGLAYDEIEKVDENTYIAIHMPKQNEPYLLCTETIMLKDGKAYIQGGGVHNQDWYIDILLNDANDMTYAEFSKLSLKERHNILFEDFKVLMQDLSWEIKDSIYEPTHIRIVNL